MGRRLTKSERMRSHAPDKSSSTPTQSEIHTSSQIVQSQAESQSLDHPDLQTQLTAANQFGHKLTNISTQTSGNASNLPLIQPKLTIGAPGDKYEQEADQVAQQVVQQMNAPGQSSSGQTLQRESAPEEEEELQMQSEISQLQRQEVDADEDEDEELQMKPDTQLQKQDIDADADEDEELQMKPDAQLQRQEVDADEDEDEELQTTSLVQRRESISGDEASLDLETSIQQARGSGQALDQGLQQKMGQAMGADFNGVRIHTDNQSDQLNQAIQAKAFTTKQDIFFRKGAYNPSSRDGQELIAHELTHVVQQGGSQVQKKDSPKNQLTEKGVGLDLGIQNKEMKTQKPAFRNQQPSHAASTIQRAINVDSTPVDAETAFGHLKNDSALVKEYGQYLNQFKPKLEKYDQENKNFNSWEELKETITSDLPDFGSQVVTKMEELGEQEKFEWGGDAFLNMVRWMKGEPVRDPLGANCWTAVLYAAYLSGLVDKSYMVEAHGKDKSGARGPALANEIASNPVGSYVPPSQGSNSDKIEFYENKIAEQPIPRGQVIVFGKDGQHVCLSLGGGQIIELNKQAIEDIPNPNFDPNWQEFKESRYRRIQEIEQAIKDNKSKIKENTEKIKGLSDDKEVTKLKQLNVKLTKENATLPKELRKLQLELKEFEGAGRDQEFAKGRPLNEIKTKDLSEVMFTFAGNIDGIYWGPLPLL